MVSNAIILGCGYVGKAVADLWRRSLTVTATTTTPTRLTQLEDVAPRVELFKGNDEATLRSLLQNQQIVLLSVGAPNADAYEETYRQTAKTLAACLKDAPTVQQVIYTGSYAVYGDRQGAWVDETSSLAPANRNGEILAETEQILLSAASDSCRVCILRLGGIYGPGRELTKIFQRTVGTTQPGDGEDATNWVHLDDIAGAIDFARQQQLEGIYNLVADAPSTLKDLLDRLCTTHNLPAVTWDASSKSVRPYNARVSNQKLKAAGYQFVHPEVP